MNACVLGDSRLKLTTPSNILLTDAILSLNLKEKVHIFANHVHCIIIIVTFKKCVSE